MIDIKHIRNHFHIVYNAVKARGQGDEKKVYVAYYLDKDRRELEELQQNLRRDQNLVSDEIGKLYRDKAYKEECEKTYKEEWPDPDTSYLDECKLKAEKLKKELTLIIIELVPIQDELEKLLLEIPNIPDPSIPGAYPHEFNTIQEEPAEVTETGDDPNESVTFMRGDDMILGTRKHMREGDVIVGSRLKQSLARIA